MDRQGRSWIFLAGISVASTLGLAAAVLPVLEERVASPWPWAHTQRILLFAFPITIAAAIFYLTDQQRRAARAHRDLLRARERSAERMQRQVKRLEALFDVSRIMGAETNLQGVFDAVTKVCLEAFGCQQASLMLVDEDTQELVVRSASGHADPSRVVGSRQKIGEGVAGWVAAKNEPLVLGPDPDSESEPFAGGREPNTDLGAAMIVPIVVRDALVGVLNVGSTAPDVRYEADDLQTLRVFAANVGTCIRHTEQAEWMRALVQRQQAAGAARGAGVS